MTNEQQALIEMPVWMVVVLSLVGGVSGEMWRADKAGVRGWGLARRVALRSGACIVCGLSTSCSCIQWAFRSGHRRRLVASPQWPVLMWRLVCMSAGQQSAWVSVMCALPAMNKGSDRRGSSASRGYGHRWRLSRDAFLGRHPFCSMCSTDYRPVAAMVVDHKIPPRLKEAKESADAERIKAAWKLFWDQGNWQPLCKLCHDSTKQRLERSGRIAGCHADGRPIDPGHHWNRG